MSSVIKHSFHGVIMLLIYPLNLLIRDQVSVNQSSELHLWLQKHPDILVDSFPQQEQQENKTPTAYQREENKHKTSHYMEKQM